ncbi:hypothetical protein DOA20_22335 [Salmonella enterica subsp. enterica serovar Newport]|nr:hypothetical protein [Salmonella enterica subsp. enterica serovar Newport]
MWHIHPTRGEFVLLAQYLSPPEASIVAGRLETDGIAVMLLDEHVIWNNYLQAQAMGGVKLLVRQQDLETARRILDDIRLGVYSPEGETGEVRNTGKRCHKWARRLLSLIMIIFLFILPLIALVRQITE